MGPSPPFINKKVITPWSKMIVVTGAPGSRTDFLAGWLGNSCPAQINPMFWSIIPEFGKSMISPAVIWNSVSASNCIDTVNLLVEKFWKSDALWSVSKSHCTGAKLQSLIPVEHADKFVFVDVLVDTPEAALQVQWETFAKNILCNYSNHTGMGRKNLSWFYLIPEEFNNIEALTAGFNYLFGARQLEAVLNYHNKSVSNIEFKVIPTEYSKIMQPDGAIELANKLGIIDADIDLWNSSLPKAQSLDQFFASGQWWEKPTREIKIHV